MGAYMLQYVLSFSFLHCNFVTPLEYSSPQLQLCNALARYTVPNITIAYARDVSECGRPPNYFSTSALEWFCLYDRCCLTPFLCTAFVH